MSKTDLSDIINSYYNGVKRAYRHLKSPALECVFNSLFVLTSGEISELSIIATLMGIQLFSVGAVIMHIAWPLNHHLWRTYVVFWPACPIHAIPAILFHQESNCLLCIIIKISSDRHSALNYPHLDYQQKRKYEASALPALMVGIHGCPISSSHREQVVQEAYRYHDVIMHCGN